MKKIIREPLLHFILIGAAFFLLYGWFGGNSSTQYTITIDEGDLDEVISKFEMQWKRLPTEEELTQIVDKRIEQEIFYQEALKMNLDHNDEIIKKRLAQKMQFLSNDILTLVDPSEKELELYYEKHPEKYMHEASFSLYQVFFSPDKRDNWKEDAAKALGSLNAISLDKALSIGDPIALPNHFENTTSFHISRQMGAEFLSQIKNLKVGTWQGPIQSGYGAHLVFIEEKEAEKIAPFVEVKEQVLEDLNYENQRDTKALIYQEFKKKYNIEFDVKSEEYSVALIEKMETKILGL